MFELAHHAFAGRNFTDSDFILEQVTRIIARSSLISVFEKMRFREFAQTLPPAEQQKLVEGLWETLHAGEQRGFETMLQVLLHGRLARWPLLTICPAYYPAHAGVFIKPTTTKRIIEYFELERLYYHPAPNWMFYEQYRDTLNEMKTKVDSSLSPYPIAFTGFLLRSIPGQYP